MTETILAPFVRLALDCVARHYPYHLVHVANSAEDVRPPRELNPAFCGCFDWHSAVHSHWALVRALSLFPQAPWAGEARSVLSTSLTKSNLAREAEYFRAPGREGFERPYGLAWLLQLAAELHEWSDDSDARSWSASLAPLESIAVERLMVWLPKLSHPIRSGEHSQTAFAMGLALDYSRAVGNHEFETLIIARARDFHAQDTKAPLAYEPSGHDFLSSVLAEADLMRRVMNQNEFRSWLSRFLPEIPIDGSIDWLSPVHSSDPSDGKLSHLDGLNLSRAWMLEGIASALSGSDSRRTSLLATAELHREAGLGAITAAHYAGAHWLGSFAIYVLTRRGIDAPKIALMAAQPAGLLAPARRRHRGAR
jgi:hypothetical protein